MSILKKKKKNLKKTSKQTWRIVFKKKKKKSCYILGNNCQRKHDFRTIYPNYTFYLNFLIPVSFNWYGHIFRQLLNNLRKLTLNQFPATSGKINVFSVSKLCLQLNTSTRWLMLLSCLLSHGWQCYTALFPQIHRRDQCKVTVLHWEERTPLTIPIKKSILLDQGWKIHLDA